MWTVGDPCTDQSLATDGQHSGLVPLYAMGMMFDPVQDTDLAALISNLPSKPDLIWFFEECYSGGMFDELAALPNRQYGLASQLYDLTSAYANPAGNNVDGWWSTLYAMRSPNLLVPNVFTKAAINDPWSPSATPYPARKGETQKLEQPQIFVVNGGEKLSIAPQKSNVAIIWAGAPETADRDQVAQDVLLLRALGYNAANGQIWVLFGFGKLQTKPAVDPIVAAMGGPANANNYLWAATKCTLQTVLQKIFPGPLTGPPLLYFMADDHGYNTTQAANGAPRVGNGGGAVFPLPLGYTDLVGNGIPAGCPQPPM
jgi:hypothetical protein